MRLKDKIAIVTGAASGIGRATALKFAEEGAIVIATESMTGEINKGDLILYERYDDQIIAEGQVIVFKKDKSTIIHRVVEIDVVNGQTRYYTKGDANETVDGAPVHFNNVIGVPKFSVPYLGYVSDFIQNPPGMYITIGIVGAMIIIFLLLVFFSLLGDAASYFISLYREIAFRLY